MNHKPHFYLILSFLLSTACSGIALESIPFRFEGNLLIVKATLNGMTGDFIIDSGAPELIINQAYFEGMRICCDQLQVVDSNGHASEARHFAIKSFSIGTLDIKKQYALTVDLSSLEKVKGIHLIGIIGYSVLKDLELLFDFDRQELTVSHSQKKGSFFDINDSPIVAFDLKFSGHIPFIIAKIGKKKLRLGLDTGAEVNILDDRSFKGASGHFEEMKKMRVKGITRHQKAALSGVLKHISIDGRPIGPINVTVISLQPLNESLTIGLDGILGMPFLKRGRVGLDYGARTLVVWPSDGRLVGEEIEPKLEVSLLDGNK